MHAVRRDAPPRFFAFGHTPRHFSANGCQFSLQIAHAGFVGVVLNNFVDSFFAKLESDLFKAVFFEQTRNDEPARYQIFLEISVAGKFDNFHAVEQGQRDTVGVVGRSDEEDVAEIVGDFQIMVTEGIILLGIQHLQKG